jgi:hypothetical protein
VGRERVGKWVLGMKLKIDKDRVAVATDCFARDTTSLCISSWDEGEGMEWETKEDDWR